MLVLKRKRMLFREEARRGMMQSEEQEEKPATNGHVQTSFRPATNGHAQFSQLRPRFSAVKTEHF